MNVLSTVAIAEKRRARRVVDMCPSPIEVARERSAQVGEVAYLTAIGIHTGIKTVKFSNDLLKMPEQVRDALKSIPTSKSSHSIDRYPAIKEARDKLSAEKQRIQAECKLEACGNFWILWDSYKAQYLDVYFNRLEPLCDKLRVELIDGISTGYKIYQSEVLNILRSTDISEAEAQQVWASQYDSFYEPCQFEEEFYVSLVNPRPIAALPPNASPLEVKAVQVEATAIAKEKKFSFEAEVKRLQDDLNEFIKKGGSQRSIENRLKQYKDLSDRIAICTTVLGLQAQELQTGLDEMQQTMQDMLLNENGAATKSEKPKRSKKPKTTMDTEVTEHMQAVEQPKQPIALPEDEEVGF